MLPTKHVIYGFLFTLFFWFLVPQTIFLNLFLLFFASIFIGFDHFISYIFNSNISSYKNYIKNHKKLEEILINKNKSSNKVYLHIFHTIEFHLLIAVLSLFYTPFFYLLIGMIFHSLLDILSMIKKDSLYIREFFFFNWLREKIVN